MKRAIMLTFLLMISIIGYSQKPSNKSIEPSISNLKLGLDEKYIIEKYGTPLIDTTYNSSRRIVYADIKLDNNHHLNSISFSFFKNKLFRIFFKIDDSVHSGLEAKYGYKELDDNIGVYGNFTGNIKFIKITRDDEVYSYIENEQISKLSESEGF